MERGSKSNCLETKHYNVIKTSFFSSGKGILTLNSKLQEMIFILIICVVGLDSHFAKGEGFLEKGLVCVWASCRLLVYEATSWGTPWPLHLRVTHLCLMSFSVEGWGGGRSSCGYGGSSRSISRVLPETWSFVRMKYQVTNGNIVNILVLRPFQL